MSRNRDFQGDDLRKIDPKFQQPRFGQYLEAVDGIERLAQNLYGKELLPTAVRWILDQGIDIAIWGGRRPDQLKPVKDIFGWSIDTEFKQQAEKILSETVTDPVGPEFMAPPPSDSQTDSDITNSDMNDLEKVL
jgi:aryl-alcohol dehydrogenase-like predicted oxidoreductase